MIAAFDCYADLPHWVVWRNENRDGRTTKVPYSPHGGPAKANRPSTWGTRSEAETRAHCLVNGTGGGIGIELGDLGNGTSLGGIDLDTCRREDGTFEPWAREIIERFSSYTEVSPSGTGAKIFFLYTTADLPEVRAAMGGPQHGREFKRGNGKDHPPAIEVYLGNRYFAVTEQRLDWTSDRIVTVDTETLLWVLTDYGPAFSATDENDAPEEKSDRSSKAKGGGRDNSRSAAAYRLGKKLRRSGATFEEMCEALRTDPKTAEWYQKKGDERQLKRIWNKVQTAKRGLPIITISGGELPAIVDQVDGLIVEHDHELFQRGGMIVRPAMEKIDIRDGGKTLAWRLVQVRQQHLIDRLTRIIDFQKYDKRSKEWYSINCPADVAGAYLERVGYWRLPVITGIVDAPTLRPNGSVIEVPGYDETTGLLYKPSIEYKPLLPNPTKENASAALKYLCKLIAGFPFIGDDGEVATGKPSASRSVWLSLMLTTCSRHAIVRAPLHGFDAPAAGSGKSLLVDSASMISSGHEAVVMTVGKSEEEFEKRLGAELLAGDPLINLDNVERPLGGELLCQCLTQRRVKVRILGKSEQPTLPCDATFSATGNNLVLTGDVTRRSLVARLDPQVERPEEREFAENPIDMIKRNRAKYVRAVLTILRAYIVAGRPEQERKPLGSYEEWSRLVRDTLIWLGEPDPVTTMEKVRNEDPALRDLSEVLNQWFEVNESREVTVKRLIEIANEKMRVTCPSNPDDPEAEKYVYEYVYPDLRDALLAVAGERGVINGVSLGKWLNKNKGRVVNGLRVEQGNKRAQNGVVRWHVVKA